MPYILLALLFSLLSPYSIADTADHPSHPQRTTETQDSSPSHDPLPIQSPESSSIPQDQKPVGETNESIPTNPQQSSSSLSPPRPLGSWSLRGFLNGQAVTLSQNPLEDTWHIHTGTTEIVLSPTTRQAKLAGQPIDWLSIPLAPENRDSLQPGPRMPERGCQFWLHETPDNTKAWCWDDQGRPQRILVRQGQEWRLIFDAETEETASLWRFLRAIGR